MGENFLIKKMFLLSNICGCVPNLLLTRAISCSSSCNNHYVTLGLTPGATQEEIKKAYFELCKKYHPDKNEGSAASTQKFRSITEAYEVLGNEKSKKLYDQKMCYGGAPKTHQWNVKQPEDYNYEAERFFYERRNITRKYTGRMQYFDFDAWNNAHYPKIKYEDLAAMRERRAKWRRDNAYEYSKYSEAKRTMNRSFVVHMFMLIALGAIISVLPILSFGKSFPERYMSDASRVGRSQDECNAGGKEQ